MILNEENYYSKEADLEYMSVSQFKRFIECEERALAELKGDFIRPYSNALLVGSYTHAAFESEEVFNELCEKEKSKIFKARGGKYSDFETADKMIETLKQDEFASYILSGEKEKIFTGELFGVNFKIKVDNINLEQGFFSDLKTTKSLYDRYWSDKYSKYVSFVQKYDYVLQMAVYQNIIMQNTGLKLKPYIVAVTKESPPDKAVVQFEQIQLDTEIQYLGELIDNIIEVKKGVKEPNRCNKCEYCRHTKKLNDTISFLDLV